jgi:hypothetical protein
VNATTSNATATTTSHCSASVIVLTSSTNCNAVITSSSDRNTVGKWVDLRVCAMTQPPSRMRGSDGGWRGGNLGLHIIRTADKIGN